MVNSSESELVINIIELYSKIQKRVGGALSIHGIGLSEYLVLNQLYNDVNQKMRRSDLAERVGLSPSGITRLINPMEKIGLVIKEDNPRDARVSLVALSDNGKKIYEEASIAFDYKSASLFEMLKPKQLAELSQMINLAI